MAEDRGRQRGLAAAGLADHAHGSPAARERETPETISLRPFGER